MMLFGQLRGQQMLHIMTTSFTTTVMGTKLNLTRLFSKSEITVQLLFGDLLEGDVGVRHKGLMLSIAKVLYPRLLVKGLAKVLPVGLCLMITVRK